jgi:MATE family multidrug resistance protein
MVRLPAQYRDLIALAAPIAGIQFAQIALTTTDLMMMAPLGMDALAAGGLAMLLYNQCRTMCVGVITGLANLVAAAIGRGESRMVGGMPEASTQEEIRDLVRSALALGTLAALFSGGLLAASGYGLVFLGQDEAVIALARPTMFALAPGLLPMVWLNVLRQFAVGMRRPSSLLGVTVASIAVNALLNASFIHGWLGIPKLGLTGVALSTTLVQAWTFAVYLRAVSRDANLNNLLSISFLQARRGTVLKIARMGGPISLTYGLEAAVMSVASVLMGNYGPVLLAASNVINQLTKLVYQLNVGLSHGASILVSRAIGQGECGAVGSIARAALVTCFVPMAVIGSAYLLFPSIVLSPFLVGTRADTTVVAAASDLLWFGVVNQFLSAFQNICVGLLRGLGNTAAGLTNTLIGHGAVGLPAMLFCSGLGLGGSGVWLGICISFGATSALLWRRFAAELKQLSRNRQTVGSMP